MSIDVRVINKNGDWFEFNRACFGFLSYINQWDADEIHNSSFGACGSDEFDWDEDEDNACGIDDFASNNLKSVIYQTGVTPEIRETLEKAMAGLPQFYGNVTIEKPYEYQWDFNIPLDETKCMQIPVIAGMMLRNVIAYSSNRSAYIAMVERGVDPTVAFVLSQAFLYRNNAVKKNLCGFYRSFGGDETIFKGDARVCDVVNMLKGEVGDAWQGPFGDTANGYGRYGDYDTKHAPISDRTGHCKDLADLVLITDSEVYNNSPSLNRARGLGFGIQESNDRVFITIDEFINKFVPFITEQLK